MSALDDLVARCEAAWKGPWFVEAHGIMDATRGRTIVMFGDSDQDDADAALIASARTDLPALAADFRVVAEALRAELRDHWITTGQQAALAVVDRWLGEGT